MTGRIVIVSYRLPFSITVENGTTALVRNAGGLVSAMLALSQGRKADIVWVGRSDASRTEIAVAGGDALPFDLYPVALDAATERDYYGGFCNDLIWPLFHYFSSYAVFRDSYYDAYVRANEAFLETLVDILQPGDFIWIHDYQLLLLPRLLRERFPDAQIGFFLHIPFPSYELFRLLPRKWRHALIEGMLGADLVGFHTNDYTQHFLDTVRRMLGYEHELGMLRTGDRLVKADFFPIGIDYELYHRTADEPSVADAMLVMRKQLGAAELVLSVDRLDYTKGLLSRLLAYERFLATHPEWHGKVTYAMIVVPSRDEIPRYQKLKRELESNVGRINGQYGSLAWRPVAYQYRSLGFEELIAHYRLARVGLVTPIRDGMNLVAKEFVACQAVDEGVLVLSEMAGAASELGESIIVNPTDILEVAEAIHSALCMPAAERQTRLARMQRRIMDYDVFTWAEDFRSQVAVVREAQDALQVRLIGPKVLKQMGDNWRTAKRRLLFFDYDGTLVPFAMRPEDAVPDDATRELLQTLCRDTANTIVIVSGRDAKFLERWFGRDQFYLIAEHGAVSLRPGGVWSRVDLPDAAWKAALLPILERYSDRCNGSFIEDKETSLAWHYREVEPGIGSLRSQELKDELARAVKPAYGLTILSGDKVLEIKPMAFTKGTAVAPFLKDMDDTFVMAVGDDMTDEDLFSAMPSGAYTIKVGIAPSIARFNLSRQELVPKLLRSLQGDVVR